ncbi:GPI-anchored surface protein, putative, partial [Bodo saltans]
MFFSSSCWCSSCFEHCCQATADHANHHPNCNKNCYTLADHSATSCHSSCSGLLSYFNEEAATVPSLASHTQGKYPRCYLSVNALLCIFLMFIASTTQRIPTAAAQAWSDTPGCSGPFNNANVFYRVTNCALGSTDSVPGVPLNVITAAGLWLQGGTYHSITFSPSTMDSGFVLTTSSSVVFSQKENYADFFSLPASITNWLITLESLTVPLESTTTQRSIIRFGGSVISSTIVISSVSFTVVETNSRFLFIVGPVQGLDITIDAYSTIDTMFHSIMVINEVVGLSLQVLGGSTWSSQLSLICFNNKVTKFTATLTGNTGAQTAISVPKQHFFFAQSAVGITVSAVGTNIAHTEPLSPATLSAIEDYSLLYFAGIGSGVSVSNIYVSLSSFSSYHVRVLVKVNSHTGDVQGVVAHVSDYAMSDDFVFLILRTSSMRDIELQTSNVELNCKFGCVLLDGGVTNVFVDVKDAFGIIELGLVLAVSILNATIQLATHPDSYSPTNTATNRGTRIDTLVNVGVSLIDARIAMSGPGIELCGSDGGYAGLISTQSNAHIISSVSVAFSNAYVEDFHFPVHGGALLNLDALTVSDVTFEMSHILVVYVPDVDSHSTTFSLTNTGSALDASAVTNVTIRLNNVEFVDQLFNLLDARLAPSSSALTVVMTSVTFRTVWNDNTPLIQILGDASSIGVTLVACQFAITADFTDVGLVANHHRLINVASFNTIASSVVVSVYKTTFTCWSPCTVVTAEGEFSQSQLRVESTTLVNAPFATAPASIMNFVTGTIMPAVVPLTFIGSAIKLIDVSFGGDGMQSAMLAYIHSAVSFQTCKIFISCVTGPADGTNVMWINIQGVAMTATTFTISNSVWGPMASSTPTSAVLSLSNAADTASSFHFIRFSAFGTRFFQENTVYAPITAQCLTFNGVPASSADFASPSNLWSFVPISVCPPSVRCGFRTATTSRTLSRKELDGQEEDMSSYSHSVEPTQSQTQSHEPVDQLVYDSGVFAITKTFGTTTFLAGSSVSYVRQLVGSATVKSGATIGELTSRDQVYVQSGAVVSTLIGSGMVDVDGGQVAHVSITGPSLVFVTNAAQVGNVVVAGGSSVTIRGGSVVDSLTLLGTTPITIAVMEGSSVGTMVSNAPLSGLVYSATSSTVSCITFSGLLSASTFSFSGVSFTSSTCAFMSCGGGATDVSISVFGYSLHTITNFPAIQILGETRSVSVGWSLSRLVVLGAPDVSAFHFATVALPATTPATPTTVRVESCMDCIGCGGAAPTETKQLHAIVVGLISVDNIRNTAKMILTITGSSITNNAPTSITNANGQQLIRIGYAGGNLIGGVLSVGFDAASSVTLAPSTQLIRFASNLNSAIVDLQFDASVTNTDTSATASTNHNALVLADGDIMGTGASFTLTVGGAARWTTAGECISITGSAFGVFLSVLIGAQVVACSGIMVVEGYAENIGMSASGDTSVIMFTLDSSSASGAASEGSIIDLRTGGTSVTLWLSSCRIRAGKSVVLVVGDAVSALSVYSESGRLTVLGGLGTTPAAAFDVVTFGNVATNAFLLATISTITSVGPALRVWASSNSFSWTTPCTYVQSCAVTIVGTNMPVFDLLGPITTGITILSSFTAINYASGGTLFSAAAAISSVDIGGNSISFISSTIVGTSHGMLFSGRISNVALSFAKCSISVTSMSTSFLVVSSVAERFTVAITESGVFLTGLPAAANSSYSVLAVVHAPTTTSMPAHFQFQIQLMASTYTLHSTAPFTDVSLVAFTGEGAYVTYTASTIMIDALDSFYSSSFASSTAFLSVLMFKSSILASVSLNIATLTVNAAWAATASRRALLSMADSFSSSSTIRWTCVHHSFLSANDYLMASVSVTHASLTMTVASSSFSTRDPDVVTSFLYPASATISSMKLTATGSYFGFPNVLLPNSASTFSAIAFRCVYTGKYFKPVVAAHLNASFAPKLTFVADPPTASGGCGSLIAGCWVLTPATRTTTPTMSLSFEPEHLHVYDTGVFAITKTYGQTTVHTGASVSNLYQLDGDVTVNAGAAVGILHAAGDAAFIEASASIGSLKATAGVVHVAGNVNTLEVLSSVTISIVSDAIVSHLLVSSSHAAIHVEGSATVIGITFVSPTLEGNTISVIGPGASIGSITASAADLTTTSIYLQDATVGCTWLKSFTDSTFTAKGVAFSSNVCSFVTVTAAMHRSSLLVLGQSSITTMGSSYGVLTVNVMSSSTVTLQASKIASYDGRVLLFLFVTGDVVVKVANFSTCVGCAADGVSDLALSVVGSTFLHIDNSLQLTSLVMECTSSAFVVTEYWMKAPHDLSGLVLTLDRCNVVASVSVFYIVNLVGGRITNVNSVFYSQSIAFETWSLTNVVVESQGSNARWTSSTGGLIVAHDDVQTLSIIVTSGTQIQLSNELFSGEQTSSDISIEISGESSVTIMEYDVVAFIDASAVHILVSDYSTVRAFGGAHGYGHLLYADGVVAALVVEMSSSSVMSGIGFLKISDIAFSGTNSLVKLGTGVTVSVREEFIAVEYEVEGLSVEVTGTLTDPVNVQSALANLITLRGDVIGGSLDMRFTHAVMNTGAYIAQIIKVSSASAALTIVCNYVVVTSNSFVFALTATTTTTTVHVEHSQVTCVGGVLLPSHVGSYSPSGGSGRFSVLVASSTVTITGADPLLYSTQVALIMLDDSLVAFHDSTITIQSVDFIFGTAAAQLPRSLVAIGGIYALTIETLSILIESCDSFFKITTASVGTGSLIAAVCLRNGASVVDTSILVKSMTLAAWSDTDPASQDAAYFSEGSGVDAFRSFLHVTNSVLESSLVELQCIVHDAGLSIRDSIIQVKASAFTSNKVSVKSSKLKWRDPTSSGLVQALGTLSSQLEILQFEFDGAHLDISTAQKIPMGSLTSAEVTDIHSECSWLARGVLIARTDFPAALQSQVSVVNGLPSMCLARSNGCWAFPTMSESRRSPTHSSSSASSSDSTTPSNSLSGSLTRSNSTAPTPTATVVETPTLTSGSVTRSKTSSFSASVSASASSSYSLTKVTITPLTMSFTKSDSVWSLTPSISATHSFSVSITNTVSSSGLTLSTSLSTSDSLRSWSPSPSGSGSVTSSQPTSTPSTSLSHRSSTLSTYSTTRSESASRKSQSGSQTQSSLLRSLTVSRTHSSSRTASFGTATQPSFSVSQSESSPSLTWTVSPSDGSGTHTHSVSNSDTLSISSSSDTLSMTGTNSHSFTAGSKTATDTISFTLTESASVGTRKGTLSHSMTHSTSQSRSALSSSASFSMTSTFAGLSVSPSTSGSNTNSDSFTRSKSSSPSKSFTTSMSATGSVTHLNSASSSLSITRSIYSPTLTLTFTRRSPSSSTSFSFLMKESVSLIGTMTQSKVSNTFSPTPSFTPTFSASESVSKNSHTMTGTRSMTLTHITKTRTHFTSTGTPSLSSSHSTSHSASDRSRSLSPSVSSTLTHSATPTKTPLSVSRLQPHTYSGSLSNSISMSTAGSPSLSRPNVTDSPTLLNSRVTKSFSISSSLTSTPSSTIKLPHLSRSRTQTRIPLSASFVLHCAAVARSLVSDTFPTLTVGAVVDVEERNEAFVQYNVLIEIHAPQLPLYHNTLDGSEVELYLHDTIDNTNNSIGGCTLSSFRFVVQRQLHNGTTHLHNMTLSCAPQKQTLSYRVTMFDSPSHYFHEDHPQVEVVFPAPTVASKIVRISGIVGCPLSSYPSTANCPLMGDTLLSIEGAGFDSLPSHASISFQLQGDERSAATTVGGGTTTATCTNVTVLSPSHLSCVLGPGSGDRGNITISGSGSIIAHKEAVLAYVPVY